MRTQTFKRPQFWLGLLVTIGCFVALFQLVDPAELLAVFRRANYGALLLCCGLIWIFLLLRAVRWQILLKRQAGWRPIFHIQNIGYMLTMLLPFRLGDVARAILVGNLPGVRVAQGASTMVVERLLDVLFFVVLLPFTVAGLDQLPEQVRQAGWLFGVAAGVGIVVVIVAANQRPLLSRLLNRVLTRPRWRSAIDGLLDGLDAFTSWQMSLSLLLLSVGVWLPVMLAYRVVLTAVGLQIPWVALGFTICVAAFGVAAPSSPGQFGVFEGAVFFALVTVLGYPAEPVVSFALLYHVTQYLFFILLGLIGLAQTGTTWTRLMDQLTMSNEQI